MRCSTKGLLSLAVLLTLACSPQADEDELLRQQVVSAVASASDLPAQSLTVAVDEGVVSVSGSLDCEDCGGMRTPGGAATVQQSLGSVIRAVPGVQAVRFDLQYP